MTPSNRALERAAGSHSLAAAAQVERWADQGHPEPPLGGELISGGEACVRAKGKFLSMSRESTAEVVPYLKFNLCRKYRTLFHGIEEAK